MSMAHPSRAGDSGQVGGHCSSEGKCAHPLEMLIQGSHRRGRTPRRFHSDLSYHIGTTFVRGIPAGGLTPDWPRLKDVKTDGMVKTPRRLDFFVCPRSSAIHWSKSSWAEGTVNYPMRHEKLRQRLCRLRKGIRSRYQTSHECRQTRQEFFWPFSRK